MSIDPTVSYFYDEPPDPIELAHGRLQEAARRSDIHEVKKILVEHPQAALPRNGWQSDVLGVLAGACWMSDRRENWIACVEAVVGAGANPNKRHNYASFVERMIEQGQYPVLRLLGQMGQLDLDQDLIGKVIEKAREGTSWKRGYPFANTMAAVLEAGAKLNAMPDDTSESRLDGLAWVHLADKTCHPETIKVIDLLLLHGATVGKKAILRTARGGNEEVLQHLVSHSRLPLEIILEGVRPDEMRLRSLLERVVLDARAGQTTTPSTKPRGTRL